MSGKRTRSYRCAVHQRDREVCSENDFHLLLEDPTLFARSVLNEEPNLTSSAYTYYRFCNLQKKEIVIINRKINK